MQCHRHCSGRILVRFANFFAPFLRKQTTPKLRHSRSAKAINDSCRDQRLTKTSQICCNRISHVICNAHHSTRSCKNSGYKKFHCPCLLTEFHHSRLPSCLSIFLAPYPVLFTQFQPLSLFPKRELRL